MFREDKPLGKVIAVFADQFLLNLLFLISCLPVITIGAAAIALYEQEYAIWEARDGRLIRDFFRSLLRNFGRGVLLLLTAVLMAAAGFGLWTSAQLAGLPAGPAACILTALFGGVWLWLLGLTGRYEQRFGAQLHNAYLLAFRRLPATLLLLVLNLAYPALVFVLPGELFPGWLFFLLFGFWAAAAWLSSGLLLQVLGKLEQPEADW